MPSASTVAFAITSEPGSKFGERLAVPAAALVAGAHAPDDAVLDQQLVGGGLGQDVDAGLLGLVGEEAPELRNRRHVVAVVAEVGRHRLERQRLLRSEQVDGVLLDLPEAPATRIRGRSGKSSCIAEGRMFAPESRCAPGVLPFSITATGTSPSFSFSSGSCSSSCIRLDRAGEAGGAAADDRDADLDAVLLGIGRRADELVGVVDRRRKLCWSYTAHG